VAVEQPLTKILVGIDLSKASKPISRFAINLASRYNVYLVFSYIIDEMLIEHAAAGFDPNALIEAKIKEAKEFLSELVELAKRSGVDASFTILDTPTDPAVGLARIADDIGASEILIGHKGHKLFKILPIGSTALSLVSFSNKPILLVKPFEIEKGVVDVRPREGVGAEDLFRKVLVAIDDNVNDDMINYVASLYSRIEKYNQEFYVMHIIEPRETEGGAKRLLKSVIEKLQRRGVDARSILLESDRPSREILAAAEQLGVTCIIIGKTLKRRKFIEYITGTTLSRLIAMSEIPLLIYPLGKK
jgi:nucleotide-binding universal stress UspA family protein